MAKKNKPTDETKEIHIPQTTPDDEFYDNTAGTIFSADSDAQTGSNKQAQKTTKKQQKQSANNKAKPSKNKKPLITTVVVISIHAPYGGCDSAITFMTLLIKNFNPRTLRRVRQQILIKN